MNALIKCDYVCVCVCVCSEFFFLLHPNVYLTQSAYIHFVVTVVVIGCIVLLFCSGFVVLLNSDAHFSGAFLPCDELNLIKFIRGV